MERYNKTRYEYNSTDGETYLSVVNSSRRKGLIFTIEDSQDYREIVINDKDVLLNLANFINENAENVGKMSDPRYESNAIGTCMFDSNGNSITNPDDVDKFIILKRIDKYSYDELSKEYGTDEPIIALFPIYDGAINRKVSIDVISCCIKKQLDYVKTGNSKLCKQLSLGDISESTGINLTMVSRCCRDVRIFTAGKTFTLDSRGGNLKEPSLFDEGLVVGFDKNGKEIRTSRIGVLEIINELIENENPESPMSDDKISEVLHELGYPINRRTVAKYRETFLNYKNSNQRREL